MEPAPEPKETGPAKTEAEAKESVEIVRFSKDDVIELSIDAPAQWSLTPDAADSPSEPLSTQTIALRAPPKGRNAVFEKPNMIHANPHTAELFITHKYSFKNSVSRVEVVDLSEGKSKQVVELEHSASVIDVSPSGQLVLMRKNGFHHGQKKPTGRIRPQQWRMESSRQFPGL